MQLHHDVLEAPVPQRTGDLVGAEEGEASMTSSARIGSQNRCIAAWQQTASMVDLRNGSSRASPWMYPTLWAAVRPGRATAPCG